MNKVGELWEQWKAIPFEAKLAMFVAPIVVFVLTAVIGKAINGPEKPQACVQVVRLLPINGPGKNYRYASIDLTLRNTGGAVSVLTRAQFQIRRAEAINRCPPPGILLPTGKYSVVLPYPGKGQPILALQVSQEIGPNQADRFTFSVGLPNDATNGAGNYPLTV
jgi:hypothetical protein